jgi:hypothetical protein
MYHFEQEDFYVPYGTRGLDAQHVTQCQGLVATRQIFATTHHFESGACWYTSHCIWGLLLHVILHQIYTRIVITRLTYHEVGA